VAEDREERRHSNKIWLARRRHPPDPTLKIANEYLQNSIVSMRKLLQERESGSKKPKKGAAPDLHPRKRR
jgi:hypothetical protein